MILCEKCKKQFATVHLTEIKSGKRREKHLCEGCARNLNIPHQQTISIQDLLGTLMEKGQQKDSASDSRACPHCNIKFSEFKKKGRLGCAYDYEVFKKPLEELFKKVHGSTRYVGKVPRGFGVGPVYKNELIKLKEQLDRVIKAEEYEEAARIRDRIIELEGLIGKGLETGAKETKD